MNSEQREICIQLGNGRYLPTSFDKRFANNLYNLAVNDPEKELTASQNEWMYRLLYKYRNQFLKTYEKYKENEFCCRKDARKRKLKQIAKIITSKSNSIQLSIVN